MSPLNTQPNNYLGRGRQVNPKINLMKLLPPLAHETAPPLAPLIQPMKLLPPPAALSQKAGTCIEEVAGSIVAA